MTARRLHAACPRCGRVEPLRPDGTLVQHTRVNRCSSRCRCEGSGAQPAPGAIAAWLAQHEAEGIASAQRESTERAAWCARMRMKGVSDE